MDWDNNDSGDVDDDAAEGVADGAERQTGCIPVRPDAETDERHCSLDAQTTLQLIRGAPLGEAKGTKMTSHPSSGKTSFVASDDFVVGRVDDDPRG